VTGLPDDQFWGVILIGLLAFAWLVAPTADWAARRLVTTARANAARRRERKVRRDLRASTTYWLGREPITAADHAAIRAAIDAGDLAARDHQPGGAA
jgi:hypothetical protein